MKNILYKSFVVLAAGLMLGSCEENAIEDHNEPVNSGAFIKFAHTAPSAPAVNFYLGNTKISALSANAAGEVQGLGYASNSVFPASYGYANVPSGAHTLQAISPATAAAGEVASASVTLNEGEHYTSFLIGEAESYEAFLVEDALPENNYSKSYIRFVNVAINAPSGVDVEVVRTATSETPETRTAVGSDVVRKGNTPYVAIDAQGSYVVEYKTENAEGAVITSKSTSFSPIAGRVYTFIIRGDFADNTVSSLLIRDR
ncbi:DUF4397 domain-containing protein [Pontibacter flavimaris]|uniref:DUF4397 domain-containing protein n=1 Tax=Pontibacter flavimaris TaxID=1797110 RepID=A0A1Q5PDT7_9BACT|nr:DUF4397 domain-containing protein [Pontibacter flavimaris]OKL40386.1 hypothetical protein A3841_18915 [Pontibacter flavimaris]